MIRALKARFHPSGEARAAAGFPTRACAAINVTELAEVGAHEQRPIKSAHGEVWVFGHRRWPICRSGENASAATAVHGGSAAGSMAVLVTLDRNYVGIVPRWARLAHQAELACVVGTFDPAPERVCPAARKHGCSCEVSTWRSNGRADASWSADSPRRVGVRARFELAQRILPRFGRGVLMHDADVAFHSFEPFAAQAVWAWRNGYELWCQPNGARKEAFDDLNFGITWFAPAPFCVQLLSCLLDTWEHPSFQRSTRDSNKLGGSYRQRSQPRLTHLLERSAASASAAGGSPRLCQLPESMRRHYTHATVGMLGSSAPSPANKLVALERAAHARRWEW